jgi:alkylation response protein AidB-like acyl-CoA dehydrogenase
MDGLDSETCAFRDEVLAFCRDHLPADIRRKVELHLELERDDYTRWQKVLHGRGWMGAHWPVEHGGLGWGPRKRWIFEQACMESGAPWLIPMGVAYVAPVIYTFGTVEQQKRFLPGIQSGDDFWCQGYSEPNAGSDLANVKTRAERHGDHYVVNGQKMWTTYAQWADWIFCLARTSQGARPQQGLSFLLIDMRSPGVTVRPIRTIDAVHHVNEVFFDDVRVPVENLVGEQDKGWDYAKFLLVAERLIAAETGKARLLLRQLKSAANKTTERGQPLASHDYFSRRVAEAEIDLRTLEAVCHRLLGRAENGAEPGVEANMLKIRGTELLQKLNELTIDVLSHRGIPFDPRALTPQWNGTPALMEDTGLTYEFLHGRATTIWGGSNEIQRTIIAKQGLGL